ncbi:hypothetical protein GCM10010249_55710 [Streptomyces roseolilacinus]|uniref:Uncharacterized protein n=1 Tax=Streptomyces roseolilacinus TaxID=66904 RepID=A0A918B5L8_9ACTN|nr:hypothetical protein GCM10010249_55710 [Streptomyces roseolilacinus]
MVGAHLARPAVHLARELALGPAAAHEPRAELFVRALPGIRTVRAAAAHWKAPIRRISVLPNPGRNAVDRALVSGVRTLRTGYRVASGIPTSADATRGSRTESNLTLTHLARQIAETPPFATPSNELPYRQARFT